MTRSRNEKIRDWIAETVDSLDFEGALNLLKEAISKAPQGAHETAEYQYIQGLIVGRITGENNKYSQETIDDMRAAAELANDHEKQGMCTGLEIARAWKPPTAA